MRTKYLGIAAPVVFMLFLLSGCAPDNSTSIVKGCMNEDAVNHNAEANEDDNSCVLIPEKQNALFFKYTATWCWACGSYGAGAFDGVYNSNKGNILAFTMQVNDDLTFPSNAGILAAFIDRWQYDATPSFVANNTYLGNPVGGAQAEIDNKIDDEPTVGTNLKWTVGGGANTGKININTYAKFFKPVSGEYYMATYILLKKIVKSQNVDQVYDDEFEHHHVMYAVVGGSPFGELIAEGNTSAGTIKHTPYVFELDANTPAHNIEVVSIVWKKNAAGKFDFINCTVN